MLDRAEFDQRSADNELVLGFVGMSGSGKSWSAKRLALEQGFKHFDCDAMIGELLLPHLEGQGFYKPGDEYVSALGRWMGQPPDENFPVREGEYVGIEQCEMTRILDHVEVLDRLEQGVTRNTVIDTTGSVVHLSQNIRDRLGALATVVVFDISTEMRSEIFEEYKNGDPKPVVWDRMYRPKAGESPEETLERCYFELLDYREKIYRGMADVVIPREVKFGFPDQAALLDYIRNALPE